MSLVLYNTATRRKEPFVPFVPGRVGMYVCGPTVYDYAHLGNARPVVVFDVLYRLLKRTYANVTYVRNITDVDDKINAAATARGEPIAAITARTIAAFHEDMAALNALPPDVEPRATQHIAEMIAMIERLVASGHAYVAEGHVLFHVPSLPTYGALSGRDRRAMVAGARVEVAPFKRDPADFVLWKPSSLDLPGWESPWGRGRPGWHIECSAMSEAHLGITFDIHGGGRDLIFPHHENEVAQSTCVHGGAPLVRYWLHNGFVTVEGEKMAKSVGNIVTVRALLGEFRGEAIRLALLSTHYRQPLDFTREGLREAERTLDRWYRLVGPRRAPGGRVADGVLAALDDDLNTPLAVAELHKLEEPAALRGAGDLLGLLQQDRDAWFHSTPRQSFSTTGIASAEAVGHPGAYQTGAPDQDYFAEGTSMAGSLSESVINERIQQRETARKARDYTTSDSIRAQLLARGIVLEDGPQGTTWRRAT
ncbi:MAG: cysteine--tRNA ligase [Alphaproteobacteria bacterium]|nr:cysteine--tRNA ligase [Alphaproteobacteria bacterium]